MASWPITVFCADLDLALVAADLRAVADPDEAAELDLAALGDLKLEALAEEDGAVGLPAPARAGEEAPPEVAPQEHRVPAVEHPVTSGEA